MSDIGGKFRWAERAGQVKMYSHLTTFDLHVIQ